MPEALICRWWSGSGVVDPGLVVRRARTVGAGSSRSRPTPTSAQAQGAIARADALVDTDFLGRAPQLRVVARTGVGVERVDLDAATARGIAVVITPGAGTAAVAEGAIAMAMHLVKRFGRLTALVRVGSVGRPRRRSRSATWTAPSSVSSATAGSASAPALSGRRWA